MKFDLADEASTGALIRKCVDLYGGIDGRANIGADLSPETMAGDLDVLEMNIETWQRTMRVNVTGHALTCREAIRQMVKQGTGGAIVNVSSEAASRSEEHTSELQSLMRNSYAVFCLQTKKQLTNYLHNR